MWVILLEAFVALCLLVLIIWLTMGSSRRGEEPSPPASSEGNDHERKS